MLVIDRFEGDKAVIEFSKDNDVFTFDIPSAVLPAEIEEGDIIEIKIKRSATKKRKEKIKKLADKLFE